MAKLDIKELNELYTDAETVDKDLYAEMRSNILLVAGDHYSKKLSKRANFRDSREPNPEQRLRITKNHIYRVHRRYTNAVLMYAGDVRVAPQDDLEVQDRKSAELNDAVAKDIKNYLKFKHRRRRWASDYTATGELGVLVRWNPDKGELRGYEQKVDDDGTPIFDEFGEPVPDMDLPVFKGQFEWVDLYPFNVWRDPGAKTLEDSPYLGYRELVDTKALKKKYANDPEKLRYIASSSDERDYVEFNTSSGSYQKTKNKTLVKSVYFRPSREYPRGYFFMYTDAGTIEEGELPFGVWPIAYGTADEVTSDPRGHSPIKQARPYQAEINRASSAMALHQVTIGDDKILYQSGTKLAPGALLPGVRGITYQGFEPKILAGRDGSQYFQYITSTTAELYDVMDIVDIEAEKNANGSHDQYSLLYKAANQKQRMSLYSEKFEQVMLDLFWITLELAKKYIPDDALIMAVGRREVINIPEFRSTTPLQYQIKVEPQDETIETKFGRQLTMQHILQYSGQSLGREDIGLLIQNMPFANVKKPFRGMTVHYDAIENEILALERGELPEIAPEMDHNYAVQSLTLRINESDFKYLDPQIQEAFRAKKQEHLDYIAQQKQAEIDLKNEFIPVDGPLVKADVYVSTDPENPNKVERARLPQRALEWLIERLNAQGASFEQLEKLNAQTMAELSGMLTQQGPMPGQVSELQNYGGTEMPLQGGMYAS